MSDPDNIRRNWPPFVAQRIVRDIDELRAEQEVSLSCARCSGGVGMLCDRCVIEVAAAAIETIERGPDK